MDFDDDVVYCYEIQLEPAYRRKGLGKNKIKLCIYISRKYNTPKNSPLHLTAQ